MTINLGAQVASTQHMRRYDFSISSDSLSKTRSRRHSKKFGLIFLSLVTVSTLFFLGPIDAHAADFTVAQIKHQLALGQGNLKGKDLSGLDLSGIDFRGADLSGANLFASKLVSANFSGANLSRATLNGAWLMGTNFTSANLVGASLLSVVILGGEVKEMPNFAGANLSEVRMIADLPRANLAGANLSRARIGVNIKNQGMGQMRTDLTGANLYTANLSGADLNRSLLEFADLRGAHLENANLYAVKLGGADLTGADISGADFTEADLRATILKNVKGKDTAKGLNKAINRDKIIF